MSQAQAQRLRATVGVLQIAIIVLVVITALIHLMGGISMLGGSGPGGPDGPPSGGQGGPPNGGQGGPPGGGGFNIMQFLPIPLPILFLLNGIGYLVLVAALYLPQFINYRRIVRWLLIIFAAVTIVMYFLIAGLRPNPIGLFDKAIEVALIVLLFIEDRRSAREAAGMVPG